MSRGNNKQPIFLDSTDYHQFLALLASALARFKITCHAFCLLVNHVHLLVTPWEQPLWRMMQQLNSTYCSWFNQRHERVGHVLQGRYKSKLIDDCSYFLNATRYLALNPVVAKQVEHPEDWPWSSYRAAIGLAPSPPFIDAGELARALDAVDDPERHERLRVFVNAGACSEDGWRALMSGSDDLGRRVDPLVTPHRDNPEFSYAHKFATRPPLVRILGGRRDEADAVLHESVHEAFCVHGYTLREIADLVGKHPGTIWTWVRRVNQRRQG
jgi:REP element-mobilizing transposase RayT